MLDGRGERVRMTSYGKLFAQYELSYCSLFHPQMVPFLRLMIQKDYSRIFSDNLFLWNHTDIGCLAKE